jgi:plastocyanin
MPRAFAALLLPCLALAGCTQQAPGEERDTPATDPATWGTAANPASGFKEVLLLDDRFDPAEYWVQAGTRIEFDNKGQSVHTATADDASFDTGDLSPTARREHVVWFNATGDAHYHCRYHGDAGMRGLLHVVP